MTAPQYAPGSGSRSIRWGLGDTAAGLLLAYALAIVVAVIAGVDPDDLSLGQSLLLQVPLWVGFAAAPLYAGTRKGNGVVVDFGLRSTWLDVPAGLALGVATQLAVAWFIYWPVQQVFESLDAGDAAREVVDRAEGAGVAALVLGVVLVSPFTEELFWRGLTYRSVENRWGSSWAVVASAVAFAALHLQPVQFPGLFVFGLVAGYLVYRTDRLGPAIWAHVGFNATTVTWLLLTR